MFENMRRLYPRGEANPGICVDADGAILGPDCVLVSRTPSGFGSIERNDAKILQKCLFDESREDEWLFQQCRRIADALNRGEIALAQIYGLYIPVDELKRTAFARAGFNPDEPRIPKGDPHGGEWTGDGSGEAGATVVSVDHDCAQIKQQCYEECQTIYLYTPQALPGTGRDMFGRLRRCIRECCERHGCYDY